MRVALDTPLRRLFDYLPARGHGFAPQPGVRVRVPFGRQRLVGVVHSLADSSPLPFEKLKPLLEVIDAQPVVDAAVMELIEFSAQYYHHPIGEVLSAALPKLAREGAASRAMIERWYPSARPSMGHALLTTTQIYLTPRKQDVIRRILAHHDQQTRKAAERVQAPPAPGYRPETLQVLFGGDTR